MNLKIMENKTKKEIILLAVILSAIIFFLVKEFLLQPKSQAMTIMSSPINDKVEGDKFYLTDEKINCGQVKNEIMASVDQANFCDQDNDCSVREGMGCPFGCYTLVNKTADLIEIRNKVRLYEKNCVVCEYICRSVKEEEIKCRNHKCVRMEKENY